MKACLGIDTSCYTTSAALCCFESSAEDGRFFQERALLKVPEGDRGLIQSQGVFQHIKKLPELLETLFTIHSDTEIVAVCASEKPRSVDGSYMPVFLVGVSIARALAATLQVPLFFTTHQEGHIRAARVGTCIVTAKPYMAIHLSGGTTEILRVDGENIRLLGGSLDLHAGQLIDRVGVAMGLPFPAGPALEKLALAGKATSSLSSSLNGLSCHFSGAETQAKRWLETQARSKENIAAEVFSCVARTVARLIVDACEKDGIAEVLLGGGVISSSLIRTQISERVAARNRTIILHYAKPELAGDNAVGVALIGVERLQKNYLNDQR